MGHNCRFQACQGLSFQRPGSIEREKETQTARKDETLDAWMYVTETCLRMLTCVYMYTIIRSPYIDMIFVLVQSVYIDSVQLVISSLPFYSLPRPSHVHHQALILQLWPPACPGHHTSKLPCSIRRTDRCTRMEHPSLQKEEPPAEPSEQSELIIYPGSVAWIFSQKLAKPES